MKDPSILDISDPKTVDVDVELDDSHFSSNGVVDGGDDLKSKEKREIIAKEEGKVVFVLRGLVMLVLILSAIAVSLGAYFYVTDQETTAFETKFNADAGKVLES